MIHGRFIQPKAFSAEGTYARHPENAVNGSDMSGYGGMGHTCGTDLECVWLSARDVLKDIYIGFDFGSVIRLGYLCIWNFNQSDGYRSGLKRVKICYSYDNATYFEFKGKGYPYEFACADGKQGLKATNLNDGKHSPVDFGGLSARYIKIIPDIESGEGCHGKYLEGQTRYGLSQVRFFLYRKEPKSGGTVYARGRKPEHDIVTSTFGIMDGLQGTDKKTMYLSPAGEKELDLVFDLNMGTVLSGVDMINYNEPSRLNAGLKCFTLHGSLDGLTWKQLGAYQLAKASGCPEEVTRLIDGGLIRFEPFFARYIKITLAGGPGNGTYGYVDGYTFRYGLSKIRFLCAEEGYYSELAREWTALFSRYEGWTGADGIFITNLSGREVKPSLSERDQTANLITFGDTFLGSVNPVTQSRKRADFVNQSFGYMKGLSPDTLSLDFVYGTNGSNTVSNLVPVEKKYHYWMQDCVITGGKLYFYTDNVVDDSDNHALPEGFRFHLEGVDMIIFNIKDGRVDYKSLRTKQTPLFVEGTKKLMFGCGIFANTEEAGMAGADGYIYIYGIYDVSPGVRKLIVARTLPEQIENFDSYTFYTGNGWSDDIYDSEPIAEDLSPEMSVMPVDAGKQKGSYVYIYSSGGVGAYIMAAYGKTPYGPFEHPVPIHCMNEVEDLDTNGTKKVYQYNAKAHYGVSEEGELLFTYNVNSMDYESNLKNGNIYRPRFVRYREFNAHR